MNLHALVRGAVQAVKPDTVLTLFRSIGVDESDPRGLGEAQYLPGITVRGNVQSEGDAALNFSEHAGQNTVVRRIYLYAPKSPHERPWAMWRPLSRIGDIIVDEDGNHWFVDAVVEDFSADGWVSVRATLQNAPIPMAIANPEEE